LKNSLGLVIKQEIS